MPKAPLPTDNFFLSVNHDWIVQNTKHIEKQSHISNFSVLRNSNMKKIKKIVTTSNEPVIKIIRDQWMSRHDLRHDVITRMADKYITDDIHQSIANMIQLDCESPISFQHLQNISDVNEINLVVYSNVNRASKESIEAILKYFYRDEKIKYDKIHQCLHDLIQVTQYSKLTKNIHTSSKHLHLAKILKHLKLSNEKIYAFKTFFKRTDKVFESYDKETFKWVFRYLFIRNYSFILQKKSLLTMINIVAMNTFDDIDRIYLEENFSNQSEKYVCDLIKKLKIIFSDSINTLSWLTPATKRLAHDKLQHINVKVGYTKKMQYRDIKTIGSNFLETLINMNLLKWEKFRNYEDHEFQMKSYEVNAYYSPNMNEIVFPAGILQAPFFSMKQSFIQNLASIGSIIGHELHHAFDNQGSLFDKYGNYANWWESIDSKRFHKHTKNMEKMYSKRKVCDFKIDGLRTLGENIADAGGLNLIVKCLKSTIEYRSSDQSKQDGLLRELFIEWAKISRSINTCERAEFNNLTDPHTVSIERVNTPIRLFDDFHRVFNTHPGDRMYLSKKERIVFW